MPVRNQFESDAEFEKALADWFAGQALVGTLANIGRKTAEFSELSDGVAIIAYRQAYVMLAARKAVAP